MSALLLDTHVWVWWANRSTHIARKMLRRLDSAAPGSLRLSAISCWEVAKLVQKGRLLLSEPAAVWVQRALSNPAIVLEPISPEIAVESAQLPGAFHDDPVDQMIVATARVQNLTLATADKLILGYPHVKTIQAGKP